MRSFASIATFATLAFAAVCSALPTPQTDGVHAHPPPIGPPSVIPPHLGPTGRPAPRGEATDALAAITGAHSEYPRDDAQKSVVQIIVDVTGEVKPMCDKLTAAISGDIEVDVAVNISVEILGEILAVLVRAVGEIKAAIVVGVDLLVLDGVTLAVGAVAKIVADLLCVVVTVLGLVVKVCVSVDISALLKIVINIGVQLAAIVALVVQICGGLIAALVPLLGGIIEILIKLNLSELLKVLAVVYV